MSELPITKQNYDNEILMTDFIAKIKNSLETNDSLKFTPLFNSYKIDFVVNDNKINLLLDFNKKKKTELIVNMFINEIAEKSFKSVSLGDNEKIIVEILK